MNTKTENKICVNCQKNFSIDEEDFNFYKKMKVPAPTWCPECQFIRRMLFRNENKLYHHPDNAPGADSKKLISIYSEDKPHTVYEHKYWWGDEWDAYSYGKDYDFSKPFFEQMKELIEGVPVPNLNNWNAVNSDYCNCTAENKNCYLVFGGDFNENCSYSGFNFHSRDSQDLYFVEKCELCYENIDVEECFRVLFSRFSKSCTDSMFLFDCVNCSNCLGCVSLRNKSYCIFNQQYTKEEYEKLFAEYALYTYEGIEKFKIKFNEFRLKFPHKYTHILKSINCIGHNIVNGKNCLNCFDVNGGEDLKNASIIGFGPKNLTDSRSVSHAGHGSELLYDCFGVFSGSRNVKFSLYQPTSIDVTYGYICPSSTNIFGCVGLKKGNYAILNKRYTKEEYEILVPKIIQHMNDMPYVDQKGIAYKYGEFFPTDLSPFAYNETVSFEHFPLTKEEALIKGYKWKDKEEKKYNITIESKNIPSMISEVPDSILQEVLGCMHGGNCNDLCTTAFKITKEELSFYRRMNLPLPRLCPNCRHYARVHSRNPFKLWHRKCMKEGCENEFETSYAPERPEIIYCERCYQQEVY